MGTRRRAVVGTTVLAAVVLCVTSAAWACIATGGPALDEVAPVDAPVGAAVAVAGSGWDPSAPVDLFFSPDGSQLLQPALTSTTPAANGAISAWVRVPQAEPGPHFLVAQQVTSQATVSRPAVLQVSAVPGPAAAAVGSAASPGNARLAASASTSGAGADPAAALAPSLSGVAAAARPDSAGDPDGSPAAVPATAGDGAQAQPTTAEASTPQTPARSESSPRAVTNDLWSGYSVAPAPGLTDLAGAAAPGTGLPPVTLAMAAAVVAMSAGFAVQEVLGRRRRVRLDGTVVED